MKQILSGKQDVYIEIAEKYKEYIDKGILSGGEKLPSVRDAACSLGVNPNTVAKAYARLEEEGYIVTLPKKGAYVKSADDIISDDIINNNEEKNDNVEGTAKEMILSLMDKGCEKETLLKIIEEVYR